jgi:hypothetical protein
MYLGIISELMSLDAETLPGRLSQLAAFARDEYWYAHFFREDQCIIVYRDCIYNCSTDPASWQAALDPYSLVPARFRSPGYPWRATVFLS